MNRFYYLPFLCSFVIFSCDLHSEKTETIVIKEEALTQPVPVEIKPTFNIFGIDESLDVETHFIRRNESLSTILRNNGFESHHVHELSKASNGVFDLRRIRAGRPLHLYSRTNAIDGQSKITYIVYEENNADYVQFALDDSVRVTRKSKPFEIKTRVVEGVIYGSLSQTLQQAGVDHQLTHRLADVFAWQVDFYRILPGDHFTVLFEEKIVEGEVTEIGRIKAAVFNHRNTDYYAFHFRQNETDEYFDEEGNSMRRQFMAAPLDYTRISSRFTNRRFHPILRRNVPHHGTDYAAPAGTPIRAVGDGAITVARRDRNNGNYIRIRHNSIYETGYLHMSRFADGIRPGTNVQQGQIIGYVGSTGLATGPHLCFRFWQHGNPVNPLQIDLPPAEPISSEHLLAYINRKEELLNRLKINSVEEIPPPVTFAINVGYKGVLTSEAEVPESNFEL